MRSSSRYLSIATLVVAAAFAATAQERNGSVEGVVIDQQSAALPGVTVTISGVNMMGERTAVSDDAGRFRFPLIPPGKYAVKAALEGFQTVEKGDVPVSLGKAAILEFVLPLGTFAETVEVTADQVLVDTTSSEVGGNLTGDFVAGLATDRQYQMVMTILPGTVEGNNPYMHGAAGSDNMYLVDGADTADPMTRTWSSAMNFDNLEDIQVITGGVPAEYGKGTGAVVNLVTKSGSNTFHGLARYTYSDTDINGTLRGDRFAFNEPTKYTDEKRPAFNLGGPILKDKLWFFTSYEKRDKKKPITYIASEEDSLAPGGPIYTQTQTSYKGYYASGKLTFQLNPYNTFFVNYMKDPIDIPMRYAYSGGLTRAPSAEVTTKQGGTNTIAAWTGILSSSSILDVKYNQKRAVLSNIPFTIAPTFSNGLAIWGGATSNYQTNRDHDIYSATFSHYAEMGSSSHELKAGIEYSDVAIRQLNDTYPGGSYTRYRTGTQIPQYQLRFTQYPGWIDTTTLTSTAFVQDSWRVSSNFTINLGVRAESMQSKNNQGQAIIDWGWSDRLQPRLGFAWNLDGANLHGSLGRYQDTIYDYIAGKFSPVPDLVYDRYNWSVAANDYTFFQHYVQGASYVTRADLKSPYMDEATLGYEGKLSSDLAWGSSAVWRRWEKGIEDDDGQVFPGVDNPPDDGNYHYMNLGKTREYKALELYLKKTLSAGKLQFLTSYTYSKVESYWDDSDVADFYADNPYSYYHYWGEPTYDRTHVFKFNGSYLLPWGFAVGSNFLLSSGAPYTVTADVETSDGRYYAGSYYVSRHGAERAPSYYRLDLRIEKSFHVGPLTLAVYADIFNVTDNQQVFAIDGSLGTIHLAGDAPGAAYTVVDPNPSYGQANEWQFPRSYFFGFKVEF